MEMHEYIERQVPVYGTIALSLAKEIFIQEELYEIAQLITDAIKASNQRCESYVPTDFCVGSILEMEIQLTMKGFKTVNSVQNLPEYAMRFIVNIANVYDIDKLRNRHEVMNRCVKAFENPKELIE